MRMAWLLSAVGAAGTVAATLPERLGTSVEPVPHFRLDPVSPAKSPVLAVATRDDPPEPRFDPPEAVEEDAVPEEPAAADAPAPPAWWRLRFVDERGDPVPGVLAEVNCSDHPFPPPPGLRSPPDATAVTGSDGTAWVWLPAGSESVGLEIVPPGSEFFPVPALVVFPNGEAFENWPRPPPRPPHTDEPRWAAFAWRLRRATTVSGWALDEQGRGAAGLRVRAHDATLARGWSEETRTREDGSFEVAVTSGSVVDLVLHGLLAGGEPGALLAAREDVRAGAEGILLQASRTEAVEGVVVGADGTTYLPPRQCCYESRRGAVVLARLGTGTCVAQVDVRRDGTFRIGLPSGLPVRLEAHWSFFQPFVPPGRVEAVPVSVPACAPQEAVRVVLHSPWLDADPSRDTERIEGTVEGFDLPVDRVEANDGRWRRFAPVSPDGTFAFERVPAGTYSLLVHAGPERWLAGSFETGIPVTLRPPGR